MSSAPHRRSPKHKSVAEIFGMLSLLLALSKATALSADLPVQFADSVVDIYSLNAETFLVESRNTGKTFDPGVASFWHPAVTGQDGVLTFRYSASGPITRAHLCTRLFAAYNFGNGNLGRSSLWAASDGVTWARLLDVPTPSTFPTVNLKEFDADIPSDLSRAGTVWLQVRMRSEGVSSLQGQFMRHTLDDSRPAFQLEISTAIPDNTTGTGPSIITPPTDQNLYPGGSAVFHVKASGTGPLLYQWYRDGIALPGEFRPDLVLSDADAFQSGVVFVRVTDDSGSTFSAPAALTLDTSVTVTSSPGGAVAQEPSALFYELGTRVSIKAIPTAGFAFRAWAGDIISRENPTELLVDGRKNVTAVFASLADLTNCMTAPAGLLTWWSGDGTTLDLVGTNHVRLSQGTRFAVGRVDLAFSFDGADDSLETDSKSISPPWTSCCWIKRQDSLNAVAAFLSDDQFALKAEQIQSGRKVGLTRYHVADWAFNYVLATDQWAHMAFVGLSNRTDLYVNGALQDSLPVSINLPIGSVGKRTSISPLDQFKGQLDEIMLFGRDLSSAEITALYSAGGSAVCKPPVFLSTGYDPQNGFSAQALAPAGKRLIIQKSSALNAWQELFSVSTPDGLLKISSAPQESLGPELFRIVLPP
jgi:hypothetical protein